MSLLAYDSLPSPDKRFELKEIIGTGVCSKVYRAIDKEENNRSVAIKCQRYEKDMITHINEEYRILRDFSSHPNLPDFHGVYRKQFTTVQPDEIWFILEFCEPGSVIDIIKSLHAINKRISEEHIAYILSETAKGLLHLHENHVIHRDVRGSNILMANDGSIKLCDFGLARDLNSNNGKRSTFIGSPNWMAPEVVASSKRDKNSVYENRADVWALGITAIELADGKPPFGDMNPTRTMFQILRNPPPTLYRPSNWSQNFNDFIAECLEKNPDHRPFLAELMEHPFFTELPANSYHLSQELKILQSDIESINFPLQHESIICQGYIQTHDNKLEKMFVEDLAALEPLSDDAVNPNKELSAYDRKFHNRYMYKSRSENAPHIFAVADSAYQDMLHHEEQQFVLFSGESYSGKTTNMRLAFKHLVMMGEGNAGVAKRVTNALQAITALTHSGTLLNQDSTRCVLQLQMTFGRTGKLSGALQISFLLRSQPNFHIFYYFYDAMEAEERLKDFNLECGRQYRYLRVPDNYIKSKLSHVRDDPLGNAMKFKEFEQSLLALDFPQDTLESIYKILAAILILGEIRFKESETDRKAAVVNPNVIESVAEFLKVDEKKFQWSLVNYCIVIKGSVEKRRHTADEARDARDVLAGTIYARLVDFIVNTINHKLAFNRAIFGDVHSIILMDLFGFECNTKNHFEQLIVNSFNEQMQYHFNQRCFIWEMIEQEEEHVPVTKLQFYDNKIAVDHLMSNPKGLFHVIDDASRGQYSYEYITESINNRKSPYVQRYTAHEFTVAHYTGKVTYDSRDLMEKNRDFIPPEMMETLRGSTEFIIKICFSNPLTKSGNLTMALSTDVVESTTNDKRKSRWGAALLGEKYKSRKMNTLSRGQYSQIHKMRTLASIFRGTSLEILKNLSVVSNSSGVHYVRCMRADLEYRELGLNEEVVRQQMRAMSILDTARARQKGFSVRIPFAEFLRRYKFLAFEFDENVEITKENCRLLLIRLKMEGWLIGTSKVFLKYYNEEFLARLYETQVKKIIKVQSMMRAFLAKRQVCDKMKTAIATIPKLCREKSEEMDPEVAVIKIQTAFRGYQIRKKYGPLINSKTGKIDFVTAKFIEPYAFRWKKKSIYQILLQYRSIRHLDLVNFSQQVHIYNQRMVTGLTITANCVLLDKIDLKQINKEQLGPLRRAVWKIPFRLDEIPFFDTTYLCEPAQPTHFTSYEEETEPWDAPFRHRNNVSTHISSHLYSGLRRESNYSEIGSDDGVLVNEPFTRDPNIQIKKLKARRYDNSPRPSIVTPIDESRRSSHASTPLKKSHIGNLLEKFNEKQLFADDKVYKKRSAPKPPADGFNENLEHRTRVQKKANAPPRPSSPHQIPKPDPIKEMQSIGKIETTPDDNEPPFNFQGMLRKTKYHRSSMKRTGESNLSTITDDNNNSESYVESLNSYSTVVFHSKVEDPIPLVARKSPQLEKSECRPDTKDLNANPKFVQEEIVPGIIVEGYVEDL
ncbi:CLUMA_CG007073, isoform A [Clunio marinus]|uniref:non-specific serine/threonine protein kinase n=1 Tax=Clunio marinus TaxID=568069 RepID=A0A1J1I1S5_9DIPT|nr:CLUMA_CG007073, isoform A [Clunio marinus]